MFALQFRSRLILFSVEKERESSDNEISGWRN